MRSVVQTLLLLAFAACGIWARELNGWPMGETYGEDASEDVADIVPIQAMESAVPEVQNFDDNIPVPYRRCRARRCVMNCCINSGRKRRSIDTWSAALEETEIEPLAEDLQQDSILASPVELSLYADETDRQRLGRSRVILAERYERPLLDGVPDTVAEALGGKQSAVVVTLTDGRKFLVVKGNQKGRGRKTVVIPSNHMSSDWVKTATKDISQSTVRDFVKAGGKEFDILRNNGRHAADRMMALE